MYATKSELDSAKYWRRLADNARVSARTLANRKTKGLILGFAESYDRMARNIEKSSAHGKAPR